MLRSEHVCQIGGNHNTVLFHPERGSCQKLLESCRRIIMASNTNPGSKMYLRSRGSITYQRRLHLRHYRYIIHPFSLFSHFWSILMIAVLTTIMVIFPLQAAFDMHRRSYRWTVSKNILLLICCGDIVVNLMTGYFDEEQRIVEMNLRKIINRYMFRGTFFLDLISSVPTDLFFIRTWNEFTVAREVVSLMCAFRVVSLSMYIENIARIYQLARTVYEFGSILFWLLIVVHWLACISWIVPIMTMSMRNPQSPKPESWIHQADIWESDPNQKIPYLKCLLRAVSTFLRSGFLADEPRTVEDLNFIMMSQFLGTLTKWILLARFMQFFKGLNSSRLKYQAATAQLRQYMRHKHLPYPTQYRIIAYYEFRFQHRYFRDNEILNTLSTHMRQEINMHSCRKLVENVTFFTNLPLSILSRIVALLKSEIFLTNDVIVRANQPGDCMFFIATGTVAVYTPTGKEVCHLEDGAHFGEIALVMPDAKRVASVVAVESCEIYKLSRGDFARTIHPYPMLWERIKKIAVERHEKTMILNAQ
ncbi:potassium/sodium hyperpolarization-activated cyclic nucleotide-gated channel 1-like [Prorops nasuta]|uniref:potassium/sodium hyperpolarization-activated cyclic nucleotide-gated channel 1-like n=1 Tax=Prorops nasuta TaxID=863751 RepID=UPI0034CF901C